MNIMYSAKIFVLICFIVSLDAKGINIQCFDNICLLPLGASGAALNFITEDLSLVLQPLFFDTSAQTMVQGSHTRQLIGEEGSFALSMNIAQMGDCFLEIILKPRTKRVIIREESEGSCQAVFHKNQKPLKYTLLEEMQINEWGGWGCTWMNC